MLVEEAEFDTPREQPETIDQCLEQAVRYLLKKDWYLFRSDLHERAICGRLLHYLVSSIDDASVQIDMEYNKRSDFSGQAVTKSSSFWFTYGIGDDTGTDATEGREYMGRVTPDLVIHRRGSQDDNRLAVEIKKEHHNAEDKLKAKMKLIQYVNHPFDYDAAVYLCFSTDTEAHVTDALITTRNQYHSLDSVKQGDMLRRLSTHLLTIQGKLKTRQIFTNLNDDLDYFFRPLDAIGKMYANTPVNRLRQG